MQGQNYVLQQRTADKLLCHLDIRLENICFQEDYTIIFIDMDRSRLIAGVHDSMVYNSCMYRTGLTGIQLDWLQLGCLILWCLTGNNRDDYHKQKIDPINHDIVEDKFFFLWNEGTSEQFLK